MKYNFKSLGDGRQVELKDIVSHPNIRYRVGCDSINIKHKTVFITTIIGIYPERKGAFVFYHKDKVSRIKDIHQRLWKEVEMAVEFASYLRDEMEANIEAIDFDLNIIEEYPSSRLAAAAIGFAKASGFESYCKPEVLFSIYAADFISHNQEKRQTEHMRKK